MLVAVISRSGLRLVIYVNLSSVLLYLTGERFDIDDLCPSGNKKTPNTRNFRTVVLKSARSAISASHGYG